MQISVQFVVRSDRAGHQLGCDFLPLHHFPPPYRYIEMLLTTITSLLAGFSIFTSVAAHNIQLRAHSRECFHEELHKDDKMTVTFQVGDREFGGSGNLDIDFYVRPVTTSAGPNN